MFNSYTNNFTARPRNFRASRVDRLVFVVVILRGLDWLKIKFFKCSGLGSDFLIASVQIVSSNKFRRMENRVDRRMNKTLTAIAFSISSSVQRHYGQGILLFFIPFNRRIHSRPIIFVETYHLNSLSIDSISIE